MGNILWAGGQGEIFSIPPHWSLLLDLFQVIYLITSKIKT